MALTPNETRVVVGLASSQTTKAMAVEWAVPVKTVEYWRVKVYRKLGICDLAALTRYAILHKMIRADLK
jgi:DNA-binding NarL/FixJ family response regulator